MNGRRTLLLCTRCMCHSCAVRPATALPHMLLPPPVLSRSAACLICLPWRQGGEDDDSTALQFVLALHAGAGADAGAPPQNGPGVLCAARLFGIWLAMRSCRPESLRTESLCNLLVRPFTFTQ